ncbi:MAG: Lrp/AsnC family transcriptional regulator [Methylacidiphilaceae bacterium]|nr:Lrp/AsnC family transcriptional regulator [Candidatus Methylacidiphilaceae bacterium]
MDEIDRRILDMLQRDAKMSQARIAESVGLATPSVNERIKKLEVRGFIRRFTALLDPRLVGIPQVAYVDVLLEHPRFEKPFLDEIENLLEAQECFAMSGEYGYRLKVRARDVEQLESIIREKIQTIRGVARTRVELSLSVKKDSTLLNLT